MKKIVVISDFQDGWPPAASPQPVDVFDKKWRDGAESHEQTALPDIFDLEVRGGYLERLPLACVKAGLVERAEIWTHWRPAAPPPRVDGVNPWMTRRQFHMDGPGAPFSSRDMLSYIRVFGAPAILCVWGLGVSEEVLIACQESYKIYNSIDAPALRVPPEVSRHFDLVITGAQWQSDEVEALHPGMATIIMPIGPEFASDSMFHPTGEPKLYDIIYVAAAQAYKRHDILFEAMARLPESIRALCVLGYGEMGDALRQRADAMRLDVDFIGPPGVPIEEVNRLMNSAKFGVVCGVDDGAPAIITEYMLAGLPVLANSALRCGLQYITPTTGICRPAEAFHLGIREMLASLDGFSPRQTVQKNWVWQHSIERLRPLIAAAAKI